MEKGRNQVLQRDQGLHSTDGYCWKGNVWGSELAKKSREINHQCKTSEKWRKIYGEKWRKVLIGGESTIYYIVQIEVRGTSRERIFQHGK